MALHLGPRESRGSKPALDLFGVKAQPKHPEFLSHPLLLMCEEVDRGRGRVSYRAVIPEDYVNFFREDHQAAIEGFDRFLSATRKVVRERLLRGNKETALARGFIARVRPEDQTELIDDLRAAIVRTLMEYEVRAEGLDESAEMEILIGAAPHG